METEDLNSATWDSALQRALAPSRWRRGWLLWLLWGVLGTALTLEGTTPSSWQLHAAFWLTLPFWIAFVLWPFFALWRYRRDRRWAVRDVVTFSDGVTQLPILKERHAWTIPEPLLHLFATEENLEWSSLRLPAPALLARHDQGVPFAVYRPEQLEQWAMTFGHKDERVAVQDLARWVCALALEARR